METTQAKTERRGPFEMSTDTRILYNVLEKELVKNGNELVTYETLSAAISRDVRSTKNDAYHLLDTARKRIEEEHKLLLETITGVGVKRSADAEGFADRKREHIRKTAKKTRKKILNAIDGKPLSSTLIAKLGMFGVMELMNAKKVPQKLLSSIEQKKLTELSTVETMKLFLPNNVDGQT